MIKWIVKLCNIQEYQTPWGAFSKWTPCIPQRHHGCFASCSLRNGKIKWKSLKLFSVLQKLLVNRTRCEWNGRSKGPWTVVTFLWRLINCSNCEERVILSFEPYCARRADQQGGSRMDDIWLKQRHPARLLCCPVLWSRARARLSASSSGGVPSPSASVPGKGWQTAYCCNCWYTGTCRHFLLRRN